MRLRIDLIHRTPHQLLNYSTTHYQGLITNGAVVSIRLCLPLTSARNLPQTVKS
jgi:hypothetical protein